MPGCDEILADIEDIAHAQKACSDTFRDGRTLEEVISELESGSRHPLHDDFLILNVGLARLREPGTLRGRRKKLVYFSFDHRRLYCLKHVANSTQSCRRVRVRIRLCGRSFDEFVGKAQEYPKWSPGGSQMES